MHGIVCLEQPTVTQLVKKFPVFDGIVSLTNVFITADTGPYPEPDESNSHLPTLLP
jgi:hypothetical protein